MIYHGHGCDVLDHWVRMGFTTYELGIKPNAIRDSEL